MAWLLRFERGVVCCAATILIAAGGVLAQDATPAPATSTAAFGGPQDWSNRHVIYTRNGSPEDMWKLRDDPRFLSGALLRYMKEQRARSGQTSLNGLNAESVTENTASGAGELERFGPTRPPLPIDPTQTSKGKQSKVDWAVSLGPTAGMAVGETPAIYTANYSSPSCSNDFAVYTINATPGSAQANLVGLNNLYSAGDGSGFCSGTAPTFMFAYEIGSGPSPLSPVLSLDGTRVAWIENRGGTNAYLHVTVWVAGQGGAATAAVVPSGTLTNGVCVPAGSACDIALNYTDATYGTACPTAYPAINSHSDIYVDYGTDSGYVSANNGLLYHIKNIFSTTANPSVDFCIPVNSSFETANNAAMSGPVYDPLLNEVFITDSEDIYNFTVNASATPPNFQHVTNIKFGYSYNNPTGPGPLLDVLNNFIYLFSSYDKNKNTSVTQVSTSLGSDTAYTADLGAATGNTSYPYLFYGAFDNNYFTNGPAYGTHPASTLYTCGADASNSAAQDLFALSFNSGTGVMNATPAMSNNKNINLGSTTTGVCSPLTEFYDGTNDRLFVGMGQPAATSGSNVVTMWNIDTQLTSATTAATATSPANYYGGTSGIAADNNDSSTAQAESIYFSTEDAGSTSTAVGRNGFNLTGIYTDDTAWTCPGGLDGGGNSYSSNLLGTTLTWNGTTFTFGRANRANVWQNTTITLPEGNYSTLTILGAAVDVTETGISGTFTITYTDDTTTSITQSVSDWYNPLGFQGESIAKSMAYRDTCEGGQDDNGPFDIYGYSFAINPNKTTKSLTLPDTPDIVVLAGALSNNCGGNDYCAVKLTQSGLQ